MDRRILIENPYRPGAGHTPPYLAGRSTEQDHFKRLLRQSFANENILITGQRGVGKTVLLADLKEMAEKEGWIWVGNDLSETSTLSEDRLAVRILTDIAESLARVLGRDTAARNDAHPPRIAPEPTPYTFESLKAVYERTPGLPSDRLKAVLVRLSALVGRSKASGIILAYDEAQCLMDHADRDQFPMSLLIETVSALQKRDGIAPYMLVLSGLPKVHDALIETRTYTERMFHVMTLERLSRTETEAAIMKPLERLMPPLRITHDVVQKAVELSGGYPYLIQFFGKELIDHVLKNGGTINTHEFPAAEVIDRLDAGLFSARWNKTTDRQRAVLSLIADRGPDCPLDFSAQELSDLSRDPDKMTNSQVGQHLQTLCERGLIYRSRHGRYSFTVPMSEFMIRRRMQTLEDAEESWLTSRSSGLSAHTNQAPSRAAKGWSWFR